MQKWKAPRGYKGSFIHGKKGTAYRKFVTIYDKTVVIEYDDGSIREFGSVMIPSNKELIKEGFTRIDKEENIKKILNYFQ